MASVTMFHLDGIRNQAFYTATGDYTTDASLAFLTVTAGTFSKSSSIIDESARTVDLQDDGLGAQGTSSTDADGQIDGVSGKDILIFTFASEVSLTGAGFSSLDSNGGDDFSFGQVDAGIYDRFSNKEDTTASVDLTSLFSDAQLTGTSFGFGATNNSDDYLVGSISFQISAVPLPASGMMLIGALGLAGSIARRKKKAA